MTTGSGDPPEHQAHVGPSEGGSASRESSASEGDSGTERSAANTEEAPPSCVGHHVLEGEIGRGGMGVVYLARDTRLDRPVAIKSLPPSLARDPRRRARLEREAKLLALVTHPNVAAIHAFEVVDERPYLVLEYVPGQSLDEVLANGALGLKRSLEVCARVAAALEAAHERDVIHRDLKPANVRVTEDGAVKVLDFGLAKALVGDADNTARPERSTRTDDGFEDSLDELTRDGAIVGTPGYMSPEQLRGSRVDRRTDAWALGCLLFECLTGERTWGRGSSAERARLSCKSEPDWHRLPPDLPKRVHDLLERCLEKEAPHRLHELGEARAELELALAELEDPTGGVTVETGNLPRALTSFLGRGKERRELEPELQAGRLVTVTGPGGCGKTRLALELARAQSGQRTHGSWIVDLAAVASSELLLPAVASALGVPEDAKLGPTERLVRHLHDRDSLLLLDNCEHLIEACAALASRLLGGCPQLTILATSRETLEIDGELVHALAPLDLPDPAAPVSLETLKGAGATALFCQRAAAAAPDFVLKAEDAPAILEICRRLDGLPLAVELAAARLRTLSPQAIAERLDDRFRLLRSSSRSAPKRHQTLRSLIDWSHVSLDEGDRALLRRLAIFAGPFTLEAAERVGSDDGEVNRDVIDGLTRLVNRSLLQVERRRGELRYRMLESIREYGREQLAASSDAEATRERHLAQLLRLARRARMEIDGADRLMGRKRIEGALDDLRMVFAREDASGDELGLLLELACAVSEFWFSSGLAKEGHAVLAGLLEQPACQVANASRSRALNATSRLLAVLGRPDEALDCAEEALRIAGPLQDPALEVVAVVNRGTALFKRGDVEQATLAYTNALARFRALDDRRGIANTLSNLGNAASLAERPEDATRLWLESLALAREIGDERIQGLAQSNLAVGYLATGDTARAREALEHALRIRRRLREKSHVGTTLINLALLLHREGRHDETEPLYEEALALFEGSGNDEGVLAILGNLAILAGMRGDATEARRIYRRALRLSVACSEGLRVLGVLESLSRLERSEGNAERAAILTGYTEHERAARKIGVPADDVDDHAEHLRLLASAFAAEELAALEERGARLSLAEIVELAVGDVPA